jgi:hypothetical protein
MLRRVVLFALSIVLSGLACAQSAQAVRDQLFGATDALKKQAEAVHASVLAPRAYSEAMELYKEAGDLLTKGKDIDGVRELLGEADGHFKSAIEAGKLGETQFKPVVEARTAAEKAEAGKYAAKDWTKAENAFRDAAAELEGGNLNKAQKASNDVIEAYRAAEGKAINAKAKGTK